MLLLRLHWYIVLMHFSDKHLFFDLDRTLWDFDKNSEFTIRQILKNEKIEDQVKGFEVFHALYRKKNAALWRIYGKGEITKEKLRYERFKVSLEHFFSPSPELVKRIGDAYVELSPQQIQLMPNTLETLTQLKELGFKMHIITNGFAEVQHLKLANCGLKEYFQEIICSEAIGKNKPEPEIFEYALKSAGAAVKNSVMIGDDYYADITGATKIGMKAILFKPDNAANYPYENTIGNLNELPALIRKLFNQ